MGAFAWVVAAISVIFFVLILMTHELLLASSEDIEAVRPGSVGEEPGRILLSLGLRCCEQAHSFNGAHGLGAPDAAPDHQFLTFSHIGGRTACHMTG